jgi:hypothetical protein
MDSTTTTGGVDKAARGDTITSNGVARCSWDTRGWCSQGLVVLGTSDDTTYRAALHQGKLFYYFFSEIVY